MLLLFCFLNFYIFIYIVIFLYLYSNTTNYIFYLQVFTCIQKNSKTWYFFMIIINFYIKKQKLISSISYEIKNLYCNIIYMLWYWNLKIVLSILISWSFRGKNFLIFIIKNMHIKFALFHVLPFCSINIIFIFIHFLYYKIFIPILRALS